MSGTRSVFGVIAALSLTFAAAAQTPTLKISVIDPGALPLANATVSARPAAGGPPVSQSTGSTGTVELRLPLAGRYLVQAQAEGFATEAKYVEWKNETASLELHLGLAGVHEQITVTSGSRVEELQQDSPVKVDAVTRQSMTATGYERISDVLSEIPGVVTRSGSSASVSAEQVRGIAARQVAVLQDGLPIVGARGIKSGNINLNRQSTGRLERIEVVKGASSALFGSDAIGGVVNLISREPTQPVQANLNFSGGSLGTFDGRGDIGTRWNMLTAFLDLESHRQDAYGLVPGSNLYRRPGLEAQRPVLQNALCVRASVRAGLLRQCAPQSRDGGKMPARPVPCSACITTASRITHWWRTSFRWSRRRCSFALTRRGTTKIRGWIR